MLSKFSRWRQWRLIVWVSSKPWTSIGGSNNDWSEYAQERLLISDAIADYGVANLLMVCGDAHMLAMDDGTNTDFSSAAGLAKGNLSARAGFPLVQAGPLTGYGSSKSGPYSHGCVGYERFVNHQVQAARPRRRGANKPTRAVLELVYQQAWCCWWRCCLPPRHSDDEVEPSCQGLERHTHVHTSARVRVASGPCFACFASVTPCLLLPLVVSRSALLRAAAAPHAVCDGIGAVRHPRRRRWRCERRLCQVAGYDGRRFVCARVGKVVGPGWRGRDGKI